MKQTWLPSPRQKVALRQLCDPTVEGEREWQNSSQRQVGRGRRRSARHELKEPENPATGDRSRESLAHWRLRSRSHHLLRESDAANRWDSGRAKTTICWTCWGPWHPRRHLRDKTVEFTVCLLACLLACCSTRFEGEKGAQNMRKRRAASGLK